MRIKVWFMITVITALTLVACAPNVERGLQIEDTINKASELSTAEYHITEEDKALAKEAVKALGSSGSEFGDIAIYGIRKALESAGAVKTEIDEFITEYETDSFVAYETKFEDEDSAYSYYISTYEAIPDKCEILTDKDSDGFDSYVTDSEDTDTLYVYLYPYVITVTGDKTFIESLLN